MSRKRYAPRQPPVAYGFRAQHLPVLPREAWWAHRWFEALEAMRLGTRALRGRDYALRGQVLSLAAEGTHVEATVAGCRAEPYRVRIDFAPAAPVAAADELAWGRVLAGDMPMVFGTAVVGPKLGRDTFWCSCPDWSKPCKHIAAVLDLLADASVDDPGLLLRLRGVTGAGIVPPDAFPATLPLWCGTEPYDAVLTRIRRRVARDRAQRIEGEDT